MNSNESSKTPQQLKHPKGILIAFIVAAFVGFLDSAYLTATHYLAAPVSCSFFTGCEAVTSSKYATVAGVPIALAGAVYYLFWLLAGVARLDSGARAFLRLVPLTALGFLVSLGLIGLQVFVIKALCLYCIISAASSTALFALGIFLVRAARHGPIESLPGR